MKNYAPGTIVPVGTKIVRTHPDYYTGEAINGKVYTVYDCDGDHVTVDVLGSCLIEFFAPYIEEEVETDSLTTYITLKFIPGVSKGSVIVNEIPKGKGITVIQNDTKFPEKLSIDHEDYVRWLLKEHPEDFKKIN